MTDTELKYLTALQPKIREAMGINTWRLAF
jgi:hypothetical protein